MCIIFGKISVLILCPFLIGLSVFLLLSCKGPIHILDTSPLLYIWFAHIFSCFVACLSTFLLLFFEVSVQFSSVAQSCPTLCDPMDCSTPGFLVHHQLLELTQTHIHWVGDAFQPSHPLLSPPLPAFSLWWGHTNLFFLLLLFLLVSYLKLFG